MSAEPVKQPGAVGKLVCEEVSKDTDVLQTRGADCGALPTIFEAAKTRKLRIKDAIHGDPNAFPWIEQSELDDEARRSVRSWASGKISGQQCLLRLELCGTVAQLLKKKSQKDVAQKLDSDAILWVFGCARLGGDEPRLRDLKRDLESKTPTQMLLEAWDAIENECGASADKLDMDEVNLALQQLSKRARKNCSDPSAFVQVQVWRELIRLHIGAEEEADDENPNPMMLQLDEDNDDELMLQWIKKTDQEVRETAKAMSQKQLDREAERLLDHACRMLRMEGDLQGALEGWQRFDAYRIIGVARGASLSEVRRAFYKRALLLHPDKGGDKDAFQELQRAYEEIVSEHDSQKRTAQDDEKEERKDANETKQKKKEPKATKGEDQGSSKEKKVDEEANESKTVDESPSADVSKSLDSTSEEDEGKLSLDQLTMKASKAAESAGEGATSLLRHCHAALEALEERHTWVKCAAAVESAVENGKTLSEAAKLVGKYTGSIAGILEETTETNAITQKEPGASTSVLEQYTKSTAEASVAVNMASSACLGAVAEVSAALRKFVKFDCDDEELCIKQPLADQLIAALKVLAEGTKSVAVAALDAAETAESAVREQQQQVTEEQECFSENPKIDESKQKPEPKKVDNDEGDQEAKEKEAKEAKKLLEARRALNTLLDAVRSLKRTNKGLLDLQSRGRKHASSDSQSGDTLAEHRHRAFSLLAEFLDEGAVQFQEALEVSMKDTHGASRADCILFAAERGFSFVLKSSPELALPMDPKAQTLRAALAVDESAVRGMLESQLFRRMESSLTLVLLNARKTSNMVTAGLDVVGQDENSAMKTVQEKLLEAVTFLQAGLMTVKPAWQ